MNYNEALNYIHGVNKFGIIPGLEAIEELLKRLDNPHEKLEFVHISGTNGKGSTAAFISSVLIESGYKTGLYTSPFLERFNERIKVDGKDIEDEVLAECVSFVKVKIDEMVADGHRHPTEFEIVTSVAFYYFAKIGVEIVVLEVGLGGRFDATNVITSPLVSVITLVGLDHINILGDSIEKIAYEKAGIIKNNGSVIVFGQSEKVLDVVSGVCEDKNAKMMISDNDSIQVSKSNLNNQVFSCKTYDGELFENIKIRLVGKYQTKNAYLALNVLWYLKESSSFDKICKETILNGMLKAKWAGRFEILSEKPMVIIDGAHNHDGAIALSSELERLFVEGWEKTLILGVLADKEVDLIVKELAPNFDRVVITLPDNPRAMPVDELAFRVGMYCENIICIESIEDALKYAYETIDNWSEINNKNRGKKTKEKNKVNSKKKVVDEKKKKAIFCAGSLFLVGKIRTLIKSGVDF